MAFHGVSPAKSAYFEFIATFVGCHPHTNTRSFGLFASSSAVQPPRSGELAV
jgi:hypothetical protein